MTHYGPRVRSPDGSLQTVTADEGPPPRDRIPPSEIDIDAGMVRELLKSQHPDLARGKLTSVLDWGDMTVGDPATDLAAAWMLFPTDADGAVWSACGEVTPHTLSEPRAGRCTSASRCLTPGSPGIRSSARCACRTLERACAG